MALNPDQLGDALKAAFQAGVRENMANPDASTEELEEGTTKLWRGFAKALTDHIAANAEVTPNGAVPMAAGGDPVTGKGRVS